MVIYYHKDLDGQCSAYLISENWRDSDITPIPMNYTKEPDIDRDVKPDEQVFIVDYSFKENTMDKLYKRTKNIIWIDHRKTILDHPYNRKDIKGIRSRDKAACELTWDYLYPDDPAPLYVRLIGDYDTWKFIYVQTEAFHYGMLLYSLDPWAPHCIVWSIVENEGAVDAIAKDGYICIQFRDRICEEYVKDFAFCITFEGYSCLVNGLYAFGSKVFGKEINNYDMCISCAYNGDVWTIGLYSNRIDVSEIAKKYGGGGHPGAAGFTSHIPVWEMDGVVR